MKKNVGFTLIEVLIAITILVSSVFVLNSLQIRSLLRVEKDREEIERTFLVKKEIYLEYLNPAKAGKKRVTKIEEPELQLTIQAVEFAAKSALAPFKDSLKLIQCDGDWKKDQTERKIRMVTLLRKPVDDKEKKKK
ncbi:MAG: type II secretion system protein [bacterium]